MVDNPLVMKLTPSIRKIIRVCINAARWARIGAKRVGLGAMAQVDLGTRQNRHQHLRDLSRMSYAVLRAVARRLRQDGRLDQARDPNLPDQLFQFSDYLHAVATPDGLKLQEYVEELVERPPINEVLRVR